jgi:hypothetical protein
LTGLILLRIGMVINLRVLENSGDFSNSWTTVSLSIRTMFQLAGKRRPIYSLTPDISCLPGLCETRCIIPTSIRFQS